MNFYLLSANQSLKKINVTKGLEISIHKRIESNLEGLRLPLSFSYWKTVDEGLFLHYNSSKRNSHVDRNFQSFICRFYKHVTDYCVVLDLRSFYFYLKHSQKSWFYALLQNKKLLLLFSHFYVFEKFNKT